MSFLTAYVETYQDVYEHRCNAVLNVSDSGDRRIDQYGWGIELVLGNEYETASIGYTVAEALVFSGEAGSVWDPVDVCQGCKSGTYRRLTVIQRFEAARKYLIDDGGVMLRPYFWVDELEADKIMPYVKDMMERTFPRAPALPRNTRHYVITERAVALMEIDVILAGLRTSDEEIAAMAWIPPGFCPRCMP
jgi:hypothetical protein